MPENKSKTVNTRRRGLCLQVSSEGVGIATKYLRDSIHLPKGSVHHRLV